MDDGGAEGKVLDPFPSMSSSVHSMCPSLLFVMTLHQILGSVRGGSNGVGSFSRPRFLQQDVCGFESIGCLAPDHQLLDAEP